ncbi:hypothetical protein ES708_26013 [subsurface metagenome]
MDIKKGGITLEYFLTEQQKTIKSLARRIAEERILPVRAELDEKEEFPRDVIKDLADADMFRVFLPEEYEGLGGGCLDLCLVIEELSRVCSGVGVTYAASALGSLPLLEYGTEEQKQKYLPDIASGSLLCHCEERSDEAISSIMYHQSYGRVQGVDKGDNNLYDSFTR